MFLYRFGTSFNTLYHSPSLPSKPGDIIFDEHSYFLNLGNHIERKELWYINKTITPYQVIRNVCSQQTINYIHWMVYNRYSSYHHVVPLFLWRDIEALLRYKPKKNIKAKWDQTLYLFPSVLSIQDYINTHQELDNYTALSGWSTQVQKAKAYRWISTWAIQTVLATHSQIFQNRNKLTSIHVMDPHSSYYRSYQDPRYRVDKVVNKLKELYTATNKT